MNAFRSSAHGLRLAGFAGILGVCALRALLPIQPQLWFDVDPALDAMPMLAMGPTGSHVLDVLLILAATLAIAGEHRAGLGVHWSMVLLALAPLPALAYWGQNSIDAFRGDTWLAAALAFVALAHLVRERSLRVMAIAIVVALTAAFALRGIVQVTTEHDATVALFRETRATFFAERGWSADSSAARTYERRLMQAEATGWFGFSNVFSTFMGVGALVLGATAVMSWRRVKSTLTMSLTIAALACAALLVINGGKGALGATALAALLLLWIVRSKSAPRASIVFVLVAVMLAAVAVRGLVGTQLGELSLLFRAYYLEAAARMYGQMPVQMLFFGVGPAGVQEVFNAMKPAQCPEDVASLHSMFVDWMASIGAISALAWSVMIALAFRGRVAVAKSEESDERSNISTMTVRLATIIGAVVLIAQASVEQAALDALGLMLRGIGLLAFALIASMLAQALNTLNARALAAIALAMAALVMIHAQIEMTAWLPTSCVLALVCVACGSNCAATNSEHARSSSRTHFAMIASGALVLAALLMCTRDALDAFTRDRALENAAQQLAPLAHARSEGKPLAREIELATRLSVAQQLIDIDATRSSVPMEAAVRQLVAAAQFETQRDSTQPRGALDGAVDGAAFTRALKVARERLTAHPARASALLAGLSMEKLRYSHTLDDAQQQELLGFVAVGAQRQPASARRRGDLAQAYASIGRIDDARRVAREALTLDDQLSLDPLAQFSERERARMTTLAQ